MPTVTNKNKLFLNSGEKKIFRSNQIDRCAIIIEFPFAGKLHSHETKKVKIKKEGKKKNGNRHARISSNGAAAVTGRIFVNLYVGVGERAFSLACIKASQPFERGRRTHGERWREKILRLFFV